MKSRITILLSLCLLSFLSFGQGWLELGNHKFCYTDEDIEAIIFKREKYEKENNPKFIRATIELYVAYNYWENLSERKEEVFAFVEDFYNLIIDEEWKERFLTSEKGANEVFESFLRLKKSAGESLITYFLNQGELEKAEFYLNDKPGLGHNGYGFPRPEGYATRRNEFKMRIHAQRDEVEMMRKYAGRVIKYTVGIEPMRNYYSDDAMSDFFNCLRRNYSENELEKEIERARESIKCTKKNGRYYTCTFNFLNDPVFVKGEISTKQSRSYDERDIEHHFDALFLESVFVKSLRNRK